VTDGDVAPVHDLFRQQAALHARLRDWAERSAATPLRAAGQGT
jgi:hypothetical protein